MGIAFETVGTALIASIDGRLDSSTAPTIEAELVKQAASGGNLLLDLGGLDYISSAGLRVVLIVAKQLKQAGKDFVLVGLKPHIRDVFEISGFLGILTVAETRDAALAGLR